MGSYAMLRLVLVLAMAAAALGGIKQERWENADCSGAPKESITISDGAAQLPPEKEEHVTVQSGQDHGIGVRFSCTSDSLYQDPAPHTDVPGSGVIKQGANCRHTSLLPTQQTCTLPHAHFCADS